jgi:hypothetical protein
MWAVWPHNAAGFGPASARFLSTGQLLVAPVLGSPGDGASGAGLTPTLSWQAVSGVDGYQVALNDGSSWFLIVWTTGTSYTVPTGRLVDGHTYMWAVWPHNAAGFGPASARFFKA